MKIPFNTSEELNKNYFATVIIANNVDFFDYGRAIFKKEDITNNEFLFFLYNILFNNVSNIPFKNIEFDTFNKLLLGFKFSKEKIFINIFYFYKEEDIIIFYMTAQEKIFQNIHINKNKQYFEILTWLYQFFNLIINFHILIYGLYDILRKFISVEEHFTPQMFNEALTTIISNENTENINLYNFTRFNYHSIRLDFVSSGIQLVSLVINDTDLMEFSNLKKQKNKQDSASYDIILNIIKENYESQKNYLSIKTFLHWFSDDIHVYNFIKDFIFSRTIVKDKVMLEAYGGTLQGFTEKFKKKFRDLSNNNLISLPGSSGFLKDLDTMARNLSKELYKLMSEKFPTIKSKFIKPVRNLVKGIDMAKHSGIKIVYPHISYNLQPKLNICFKHQTTLYNKTTKKLERESRRTLTYFTSTIDKNKISTSLGANIIQGLDSLILYYFNETIRLFTPHIHTTALHDAKIFGNTFSDSNTETHGSVIKNIFRLSIYLSFKSNIFNTIIDNNEFTLSKEEFKSTYITIFSSIVPCKFEIIYTSRLLNHLLTHQNQWMNLTTQHSLDFVHDAVEIYASSQEKQQCLNAIRLYLTTKLPVKYLQLAFTDTITDSRLIHLKRLALSIYINSYINDLMKDFVDHMSLNIPNSLINHLCKLINNDDFMKF